MTPNLAQIAAANEERKRVRAAAPPGEWWRDRGTTRIVAKASSETWADMPGCLVQILPITDGDRVSGGRVMARDGVLDFICHAANDTAASTIDELLAEVERLRVENEGLKNLTNGESK
jgi:hypothetical protein